MELSSNPEKIYTTEQLKTNPLVRSVCSVPLNLAMLRRIKAWDMHILCQKYGVVKLIVSGQYFEICLSDLIL